MFEYCIYFIITLVVSTLFSLAGAGSSVAMIPILNFLGINFDLAKAIGLFANSASTISASIINIKRGFVDIKHLLPFIFTSIIFAPIGAKVAIYIDTSYIKGAFAIFLLISASLMLKPKKGNSNTDEQNVINPQVFLFAGAFIGLISGILGIGGGAFIIPLLIYLGYEAKKSAMALSFIIPFTTLSAFIMYAYLITIDWILLCVVALGAIFGGLIGNHLMVFKISEKQTKKLIAILLYIVAIKMIIDLF